MMMGRTHKGSRLLGHTSLQDWGLLVSMAATLSPSPPCIGTWTRLIASQHAFALLLPCKSLRIQRDAPAKPSKQAVLNERAQRRKELK